MPLARDAADDLTLEAVVVDNASGDHSVPYLRQRYPEVTVVEQAVNGGFAAGVNAGCAGDDRALCPDLVAVVEQQFGQVRPVLAGDACYRRRAGSFGGSSRRTDHADLG